MSITSLHVDAATGETASWWLMSLRVQCLRSQSAQGQVDQLWRDLTVTCRLWALAQRGSPHGHGPRTLSQSMQQRTVLTECIGIGWSPWQDGPTDNKNRWYKWCIRKLLLARVSANHFVQRMAVAIWWTWSFATQRSFHSCVAEFFFYFSVLLKKLFLFFHPRFIVHQHNSLYGWHSIQLADADLSVEHVLKVKSFSIFAYPSPK